MSTLRILVVEPDLTQRMAVAGALEAGGYSTSTGSGEDLVQWVQTGLFAAVVMDAATAPSGLEHLTELRRSSAVPVVTTGELTNEEVLALLRAGADDCLRKPYLLEELVARVATILRRAPRTGSLEVPSRSRARGSAPQALEAVEVGALRVDYSAQKVTVAGQPLPLSPIELHLFYVLARNVGMLVPRAMLSEEVWGVAEPVSKSLDIAISRLRKRLETMDLGSMLKTVRGVGFLLSSEIRSVGETEDGDLAVQTDDGQLA